MAQFDITSPDGKKYRVTAPDGATQEQVLAYAKEQFGKEKSLPAPVDYNPGIGLAEGAASLATGTAGSVAGGISGLATIATNALGLTDTPPGDRVRQVSEALTYEPRTKAGQGVVKTIAMPFEALAKGADAAGGAVTDITGSPALGTAVNTAINMAPAAVAPIARAIPGESAAAIAARQRTKALNAPTDKAIALAREEGLKVTPQEAQAGPVARGAASLAGEARLAKLNSRKNAPTLNDMVRRDVGLPDDVPLSRDALAAIRKEEGANYDAVKKAGRFDTDPQYLADLQQITKGYDTAAKDFAHRTKNPVQETVDGLRVKNMDAASAVEEVKNLRADADKAYRAGDKQLGKAYADAAKALDNMLDRHLKTLNDPAMAEGVTKYRAARQRIAKTYAADKALNETTGNIDGSVYVAERRKGVPLTGEAAKVADLVQAFPRSTQRVRGEATGPTIIDAALGLIFGDVTGGSTAAKAMAGLTARPLVRSAMASGPVQNLLTAPRTYNAPGYRGLQDIIREIGDEAALAGVAAGQ